MSEEEIIGFLKSKGSATWTEFQHEFEAVKRTGHGKWVANLKILQVKGRVKKELNPKTGRPVYSLKDEFDPETSRAIHRDSLSKGTLIRIPIEIKLPTPTMGTATFLISKETQRVTLLLEPGRNWTDSVIEALANEKTRRQLGEYLLHLNRFFVEEGENEVYANYVDSKDSVFTMAFLSKEQSETMKKAKDKGLFLQYWHIQKQLNSITEIIWLQIWKALENPEVLKGEKSMILANGFRYNASEKKLDVVPRNEVIQELKRGGL